MIAQLKCAPYAALGLVGLVLVVTLPACGGSTEAGTVPITGTVTLDGQPLPHAAVAFIGNGGARLASAQTDTAGTFKLRASLGKNGVTVSKPSAAAPAGGNPDDMLMPTDTEYARLPTPKAEIPEKYSDPKRSGLGLDVVEGMEVVELSLSSK